MDMNRRNVVIARIETRSPQTVNVLIRWNDEPDAEPREVTIALTHDELADDDGIFYYAGPITVEQLHRDYARGAAEAVEWHIVPETATCDGCDRAVPVDAIEVCGNADTGTLGFCRECLADHRGDNA
jgi:hypothetical protein